MSRYRRNPEEDKRYVINTAAETLLVDMMRMYFFVAPKSNGYVIRASRVGDDMAVYRVKEDESGSTLYLKPNLRIEKNLLGKLYCDEGVFAHTQVNGIGSVQNNFRFQEVVDMGLFLVCLTRFYAPDVNFGSPPYSGSGANAGWRFDRAVEILKKLPPSSPFHQAFRFVYEERRY